ncbi:hypothetical protein C8Q75DRAFT_729358 [Abortiporus biennis]|nr:hypothetical protein C8Q75DRAFT_729358 [Abortiporus biennis]
MAMVKIVRNRKRSVSRPQLSATNFEDSSDDDDNDIVDNEDPPVKTSQRLHHRQNHDSNMMDAFNEDPFNEDFFNEDAFADANEAPAFNDTDNEFIVVSKGKGKAVAAEHPRSVGDSHRRPQERRQPKASWTEKDDEEAIYVSDSDDDPEPTSIKKKFSLEEFCDVQERYPTVTHLTLEGRTLKMRDQSRSVHDVLRHCIRNSKTYMCFQEVYIEASTNRFEIFRNIFVDSANELKEKKIARRLQQDNLYVLIFAKVVVARLVLRRGKLKAAAASIIHSSFGKLDNISALQVMLDDLMYIFPVNAETGESDIMRPFFHPAIISLIRSEFFSDEPLHECHEKWFLTDGSAKYLMPGSLVAFVATAIHTALLDIRNGIKSDFTASLGNKVFQTHIKLLVDLSLRHPNRYIDRMTELFQLVVGSSKSSSPTKKAEKLYDMISAKWTT